MRRSFSGLLAVLLIFMLCTTAYAATPRLAVSTETAKAGDEVIVSVSTENNPGVAVLVLGLDYDKSKLEYVGFANSGISGWTVKNNAVWVGSEDNNCNGEILKLKFKVKDGASGSAAISVTCGSGDAYNYNEEPINFTTVSGGVTVEGDDKQPAAEEASRKDEVLPEPEKGGILTKPEESSDLSISGKTEAFVQTDTGAAPGGNPVSAEETGDAVLNDATGNMVQENKTETAAIGILVGICAAVLAVALLLRGRKGRSWRREEHRL